MFLQGELFCNTRRHKYSYIFIWTLPRFPSLHFPKENCVPANRKSLEGPVTPKGFHAKQAVRNEIPTYFRYRFFRFYLYENNIDKVSAAPWSVDSPCTCAVHCLFLEEERRQRR